MSTKLDLPEITRGDDYVHEIDFVQADGVTPRDLTGRTYRAQARIAADDTSPAFTFTIDVSNLATGKIVLTVPKATTASIPARLYEWDLEQTVSAKTETLFAGAVPVRKDVTR